MMLNLARYGFALVVVAAIGGATFYVASAPDRIKDRRSTAQQVCASSGGNWVMVGKDEVCVGSDPAKRN